MIRHAPIKYLPAPQHKESVFLSIYRYPRSEPVIPFVIRNHYQNDPLPCVAHVPHDLGFVVDAKHCSSNLQGGMAATEATLHCQVDKDWMIYR